MKILVLSCSTGEGHNSAAKAVCEALTLSDIEFALKDPVSFYSEKAVKKVSSLYNNLIKKTPRAFGVVYKLGGAYDRSKLPSPIYALNAVYADKLVKYIEENSFDAVISTHLYGMLALTAARKKYGLSKSIFGIITDYTIVPFTDNAELDGLFIPHEELRPLFVKRGVSPETIIATGIPVSPSIRDTVEKNEARKLLGLPQDKKIVLVMSGGVGCENVNKLIRRAIRRNGEDRFYVVLCGNNAKLKAKIDKLSSRSVIAVSFTDKVRLYTRAADAVITKAGGLSSTEVAVSGVPLVHFKPIPGCETCNAEFFSVKGMSKLAKSPKQALDFADSLVADRDAQEVMTSAQRREINPFAADDIVKEVVECLRER